MEAAERGEKFTERLPWDEEMPDNEEPKRDTQISVTERLELEDLRIDAARLREQLAIERREHADQIGRLKDIAWRVGRLNAALADVAELGINPQEWAYRLHEPEEETP